MFLFKSREPRAAEHSLALPGGPTVALADVIGLLLKSLTAEEKPSHMLLELGLLVLLLHVWLFVYLYRPAEPVTPPTPVAMEVSLIPATAPKAPAPVAKPAPAPKKPEQKPVITKKPATVRKPRPPKPPKPVSEPLPLPAEAKSAPAPAPNPTAPPAPNPSAAAASAPKAESFTEANYRANYAFNPKPEYPRIARSRGWQGKVLLRVRVSTAGTSENIAVHRSSGHEILDESAIEAVKKWKFVPARRGDTPVASSVVVPILFSLND